MTAEQEPVHPHHDGRCEDWGREPPPGLPGVTEIQRFRYSPGDRFVLRVDHEVDQQQAYEIVTGFRRALQLPGDVPVVVVPQGFDLEIVAPSQALGPVMGPSFGDTR